jgi:hypothetical protein
MNTTLTPGMWTEDEHGLDLNSGDVGGDLQATDAVSRRWIKPLDDGTYAVVDVTAYGTSEERDDEVYLDVQEQVCWTRCSDHQDPGGTELDCDYTYDHPFHFAPDDLDIAFDWAKQHVTSWDAERDLHWDGVTPISH